MAPLTTTRILLIDDDRDDRRLIIDMLAESKRSQFVVDEADSGQAGLDLLQSTNHYDVVFLDYRLPDRDGLEILQDIISLRFEVPVTIITNMNNQSLQIKAIELGAVDFLEKGKFNTDILERSCMYAIGMHEKNNNNGDTPSVGVLMGQLVNLTRDSIKAQTEMTQETREFRRELGIGVKILSNQSTTHDVECKNTHNIILQEITKKPSPKYKWILDWVAAHPVIALVAAMLLVISISLSFLLVEHLSVDQIEAIKGGKATGVLLDGQIEVEEPWIG